MTFATQTTVSFGDTWSATQHNVMINNDIHVNTSFHVPLFPFSSGIAPASGLQAAAYSVVQSSDAGTVKAEWPILAFDKDTDEGRIWNGIIPRGYGSTPTISGQFYCPTVTSGTFLPSAQIACWSDTDATVSAKAFAAVNNPSAITVPGTALTIKAFSITLTNFDSGAAIDSFSLAFWRDVSGDTAAEDVYLKRLDLFFSLA
jgi:hypothetical protein